MSEKTETDKPVQIEDDAVSKGMERLRSSLARQRQEEEEIKRALRRPLIGRQIFPVPKESK